MKKQSLIQRVLCEQSGTQYYDESSEAAETFISQALAEIELRRKLLDPKAYKTKESQKK